MGVNTEIKTIRAMIGLYCRAHHHSHDLCDECSELLQYAEARLTACPFDENKPTCRKCSIHCYRKDMKERITAVMRFAGPRMLARHPVLALRHLVRKKTPSKPNRQPDRKQKPVQE